MTEVPAQHILAGLTFEPVPDGWTPVEAVLLIKCLDEDGAPTWAFRTTDGFSDEELLGALVVRSELQRKKLLSDYVDTDE